MKFNTFDHDSKKYANSLFAFIFFVFLELTEATPASPALKPYPSWQAHNMISESDKPDIVSPFHIKVDKCNRLWVLDTGIDSMLNGSESRRLAPVRILIYDLRTDNLLRQHDLAVLLEKSVFSNIAVDDNDCEDEFAYIADAGTPPSISVYSWKSDSTWVVKHNFFNIDPLAGNFSVLGTNYRTSEGVYGLALSEKKANGYPDLYFHPLTSTHEFNVSTAVLRNWKTDGANSYKEFTIIGDRGTNAQAGASVFDKESGVVFYALPNMNEIACWRTANQNYSIMNGNVFSSPTKMVYPIDVKIDAKDRLWVLSNNMQQFLNGKLDMNNPNFFVHVVAVKEAIKNTACERGFIEKVVNKFNKALGKDGKSASNGMKPAAFITFIGSIWLWAKHMF